MNSHVMAWNHLPILFCNVVLWILPLQYYQILSQWSEVTLVCHLLTQYQWVGTYLRMAVSPNNIFERYNVLKMNFRNTEEGRFKQE